MNDYFDVNSQPQKKSTGLATASLICGCVGFIINPLSLLTIAALVCGLIVLFSRNHGGKGMATAGVIIGVIQLILEFIWAILSFGTSLLI